MVGQAARTAYCRFGKVILYDLRVNMENNSNKIITIPNIITIFRLFLLIPLFVTFFKEKYILSLIVIVVSGVSDVVDGTIARKFNMISEFGKIMDPVADKLTQLSVMILISFRQIYFLIPCAALVIKEVVSGIIGIYVVSKLKHMLFADWHGKLSTVFLYVMVGAHMFMLIVWGKIILPVSYVMLGISTALILLSFILYLVRYAGYMREIKESEANADPKETTENE